MRPPMLQTLLKKDLLKVRRKPLAYVINIIIPLFMTAMVGFIFSPSGDRGNALGILKMAVVDEDQSIIGEFLNGAVTNPQLQENMDVRMLNRAEAMELLLDNEISAVLIIPEGFGEQYLLGEEVPPLKLIKNPAQQYHPAVIEELLGVVVEGGNAIYRIAGEDLAEWEVILEGEGVPDMTRIAGLMLRMGDRFDIAGEVLFPPLVQYGTIEPDKEEVEDEGSVPFNLFGFVLPGFAGMFLFFIADNVVRDIYREQKGKTLDRYLSFEGSLLPFMISKVILSMLVITLSLAVTFGAGMLLFKIQVVNLPLMLLYAVVYSFFVTGFIVFINALAGKETRADAINGMIIFGIAFLGGNMIPANNLPDFLTETVSRYLPNYWFIRGMHHLQFGWGDVAISGYSYLMLALGVLFLYLGTRILHGKLERRSL